ncbi:hypothetical protein FQR65_LT00282 [Abscondita terminalis]|nr:hypothetical protein FQR65_LT00282 [Abscondita terminalis]
MVNINFKSLSPEQYKQLKDFSITYGFAKSKFGPCIIGIKDKQLCYLAFYDEGKEKSIVDEMKNDWPKCTIDQDDDLIQPFAKKVFDQDKDEDIDVLLKGTEMQVNVWKELINIKAGTTLDYEGVAKAIGKPTAVRAVASTVSKNKIAYLIPCHRVINKSGNISKYRWGGEKKKDMLKHLTHRGGPLQQRGRVPETLAAVPLLDVVSRVRYLNAELRPAGSSSLTREGAASVYWFMCEKAYPGSLLGVVPNFLQQVEMEFLSARLKDGGDITEVFSGVNVDVYSVAGFLRPGNANIITIT